MRVIDRLLDLLYPPRCPFCRKLVNRDEGEVCAACRKSLPYVPEAEYMRGVKNTELCVAPLYYEGSVRQSLLRYKFSGITAYGHIYADFIAKSIDETQISCDIITWVPLSRKRLRKRGYDQAEIIAAALGRKLGIPCVRLLAKTKDNPPQSRTGNARARKKNAAGVYACCDSEAAENKTVLLVDDIVTTGSTLAECAGVLRRSGCKAVYAAAAAMHRE